MTSQPFINEFHYDNDGTDAGEFIEVAGPAGLDLTGYSLVLYNGSGGAPYTTTALAGVIPGLQNGFGTLSFAYPSNGIQNGAPDAIALVAPGNVVLEFISYEGTFVAVGGPADGLTSVSVGVAESGSAIGTSIARTGTGDAASEFSWVLDANDTPGAVNNGQTFDGGGTTQVSIDNVSVSEGDSGTTLLTFTVTRSDNTGAFSVDYASTDATAVTPADYLAASGTLNFAAGGALSQTVSVTVVGDTVLEANETLDITLSNIISTVGTAAIADGAGLGTILDDDAALTAIAAIQGAAHTSPLLGQTVTTGGIVTAVDSNGFYLQDPIGDGNIATSEAIFVFTSSAPTVAVGDAIEVTGTVGEFFPGGAATGNLSTTQLAGSLTIATLSSGNALPSAVVLGAGGRQAPTANIDDDGFTSFDAATDGVDFFESLEGMRVTVPTPRAVSNTNGFGEIYTVADNGANATNLSSRGTINIDGSVGDGLNVTNSGPGSDFNPERIQIDPDSTITPGSVPVVNVGAVLNDVTGVVSYNFGNYEVIPTSAVTVATPSALAPEITTLAGDTDTLTVANYNVLNLDPNDGDGDADVANGRFAAIAAQIVGNLNTPDIIALQEIQDNSGSVDDGTVSASVTLQLLVDAIAAAGGPTYSYIDNTFITNNTNGGQPGGNIRNAFLYDASRVTLNAGSVSTTPNTATDFALSRPPLVATFNFAGEDVTVIGNHFTSKGGSTPLFGTTQPSVNGGAGERLTQAQNVASYVASLGAGANVVVLGDLNEFENEESLVPLSTTGGLSNLSLTLPEEERYSFIFDGNSQSLDHVFVSGSLSSQVTLDIVHVNTEFAVTIGSPSDHDPSVVAIDLVPPAFQLQLLHLSDGEAGLLAGSTAKNLAALVDAFEDDFVNTIILSGGDTYLPGPFLAAGTDPAVVPALNAVAGFTTSSGGAAPGIVDTVIHNLIGVEASGVGNHEWDLGSAVYGATLARANYVSVTANLDFSGDSAVVGRYTETVGVGGLEEASSLKGRLVPSAVITEGGEKIGLVGVTTQILEQISSPSGTEVKGFPGGPGPNGEIDNMALLAAQLQPVIDDLRAQGVNKIVLMSHLQVLNNERALAPLLQGVDIILAAGSNTRLGDADDVPVAFPGHAADFADTYPIITAGADGKTTLIVNTDNEYTYLGRLVVDFDANGEIVLDSIAANVPINGAYASTAENVAEAWETTVGNLEATAFASGTKGDKVRDLTDAVQSVITVKDGNVFGYSDVYLEGERNQVRTQETNLGNVSADANADAARDALGLTSDHAIVSIKNGGGIRAQIGTLSAPDPVTGEVLKLPPEGGVSQLDVENALRFNNRLMVFDTTAQGLVNILNSPNALVPFNGGFVQIGGVRFSYDPTAAAGSRVRDVVLVNENGEITAVVADDGVVNPNAPSLITAVALNFTANGGDGYLIKANAENFRYILSDGTLTAPVSEALDFTAPANVPANALGEIDAFAQYFQERYPTPETAFNEADTPQSLDTRIQNQAVRTDTVLQGDYLVLGTAAGETLTGTAGPESLKGLAGNDIINGNGGDDVLNGGLGGDTLNGGEGIDTATYANAATGVSVSLSTGRGTFGEALNDRISNVENLTGSAFGDVLIGSSKVNVIRGGGGNDVIGGQGGLDQVFGEAGDDTFLISGSPTLATVDGGEGTDTVQAGANNTIIRWAPLLNVEAVSGDGYSNVRIFGGNGGDVIDLSAVTLTDVAAILGNSGNDTITGSAGADRIEGGAGNDTLAGSFGNDRLIGGAGNDAIDGGSGIDTAVFAGLVSDYSIVTAGGTVTIVDTKPGVNGNDGTDTLVGVEIAEFLGGVQVGIAAPIVLDLDGDGVELLDNRSAKAAFDWDGDGTRNQTGWVGRDDGILVFDRDGNGKVSGAGEITFTEGSPTPKSDLDGLRVHDSNGDGELSSADADFASFMVWRDRNGNGKVDKREMLSLAAAGVASLSLEGEAVAGTYALGENVRINTGSFTRTDGSAGAFADVALGYDIAPAMTRELGSLARGPVAVEPMVDAVDERLFALLRQDMASFGASGAAAGQRDRMVNAVRPVDFFA